MTVSSNWQVLLPFPVYPQILLPIIHSIALTSCLLVSEGFIFTGHIGHYRTYCLSTELLRFLPLYCVLSVSSGFLLGNGFLWHTLWETFPAEMETLLPGLELLEYSMLVAMLVVVLKELQSRKLMCFVSLSRGCCDSLGFMYKWFSTAICDWTHYFLGMKYFNSSPSFPAERWRC